MIQTMFIDTHNFNYTKFSVVCCLRLSHDVICSTATKLEKRLERPGRKNDFLSGFQVDSWSKTAQ